MASFGVGFEALPKGFEATAEATALAAGSFGARSGFEAKPFNQNELVGVCSDDLLQPARTAGCG